MRPPVLYKSDTSITNTRYWINIQGFHNIVVNNLFCMCFLYAKWNGYVPLGPRLTFDWVDGNYRFFAQK